MTDFRVVAHQGPKAFLERAEAWLLEREAENNLPLGLAYSRRAKGESEADGLFATVEQDGLVVGTVIRTPPHKLLVSPMPVDAAVAVAQAAAATYEAIPAVLGPARVAEAVAAAWVGMRGGRCHAGMRQRIYRLDEVVPPPAVEGSVRRARRRDLDLAVEWAAGFARDVGQDYGIERDALARLIERGSLFIWEDSAPVSMVVAQGATPNGCRIGFVYTPPELRGRGYASAATARVSQRMLDEGRTFCVLYTDLGNPTSNAIYQKIGYRPIADVMDVVIPPSD